MKNNLILPEGVDPRPFIDLFQDYLSNNLPSQLITSVSNLLAIDYRLRVKASIAISEYVVICCDRLRKHLGYRVILEEDFSAAMRMFTVAITPEKEDDGEVLTQEQSQDIVVDSIIDAHFSNLSKEEQKLVRSVLLGMIQGGGGRELMNLAVSDPSLFNSRVVDALKGKKGEQMIIQELTSKVNELAINNQALQQKVGTFKGVFAKLAVVAGVALAASAGLMTGGALVPAMLIPGTIAVIKFAPIIGEKLGQTVARRSSVVQEMHSDIKSIKQDLSKAHGIEMSTEVAIESTITKEQAKEILQSVEINVKQSETQIDEQMTTKTADRNRSNDQGRGLE